jgi:hypothetical protein
MNNFGVSLMADPTTIWRDESRDLVITLQHSPDPAVLELLRATVWGNRDLRYTILDMPTKLDRLRDPYFFSLVKGGTLAAVCVLNRKTTQLLDRAFDSFHFVMLATDDRRRGQGLAGLLSERIRRFCEKELRAPAVAYAYIEAGTDYSLLISDKLGHRLRSHIALTIFSRIWPKDDDHIHRLEGDEIDRVKTRLSELYDGHVFVDFDNSLLPNEYYVLRRNGEILAGVQTEILCWSISAMSGPVGWFTLNVLPWLPWLRELLPLRNFRFLRFGNIVVRPGCERELTKLLDGLLARNDTRLGLILMDERSPVHQMITRAGKLGILNPLFGRSVNFIADFKGTTEEEIEHISRQPIAVSPRDVF